MYCYSGAIAAWANWVQGFDEFMNLVIDDAVEVRLPTKTDEGKRRPLGMTLAFLAYRPRFCVQRLTL